MHCKECTSGENIGRPVKFSINKLADFFRENIRGRLVLMFWDDLGRFHLHQNLRIDEECLPKSPVLALRIGGFWLESRIDRDTAKNWSIVDDWDWNVGFVDGNGQILPVTDIPKALKIIDQFQTVEEFMGHVNSRLDSPFFGPDALLRFDNIHAELTRTKKELSSQVELCEKQQIEIEGLQVAKKILESRLSAQRSQLEVQAGECSRLIALVGELDNRVTDEGDLRQKLEAQAKDLMLAEEYYALEKERSDKLAQSVEYYTSDLADLSSSYEQRNNDLKDLQLKLTYQEAELHAASQLLDEQCASIKRLHAFIEYQEKDLNRKAKKLTETCKILAYSRVYVDKNMRRSKFYAKLLEHLKFPK